MLKVFLVGLLFFMSSSVFSKKLSSEINLSVEKYKLDNGLTVLLNSDTRLKTASYILGYRVASRHEREGITGISHMFEHLMFKGTQKYPEFWKTYEASGVIQVNAFTSRDKTAYLGTFAPDQLELVLDVESNRMTNLILNQDILDKERGAVQEERKLRVDNSPMGYLFENLFFLTFTEHPYRQPIIGVEEDIANYTLEDLKKWYETYYSPNNAVLVISGNIPVKKTKKLIEKYFSNIPSKKIPEEKNWVEPEQTEARSKELFKDVQASTVYLSYVGPPSGTKEAYAVDFLVNLLGAGESSILYKKMVREKKLLPSISVFTYNIDQYQVILLSYPLAQLDKEEEIKQVLLDELEKVLDSSLTPEVVEKARNIKMNEIVASLKRTNNRVRLLLDAEMGFDDYKQIYEEMDFLEDIDFDFVTSVGKKYLKRERLNYISLQPKPKSIKL